MKYKLEVVGQLTILQVLLDPEHREDDPSLLLLGPGPGRGGLHAGGRSLGQNIFSLWIFLLLRDSAGVLLDGGRTNRYDFLGLGLLHLSSGRSGMVELE